MDIYDHSTVGMIINHVHETRKSAARGCVVCITGPPQSGKNTFAKHLSAHITVNLTRFEVQPVAIVSVHRLTKASFAAHRQNPFTAVTIVCALHSDVSNMAIHVSSCILASKLFSKLGITKNRLRVHGWNITRALNRNVDMEIDELHMKLFNSLYTKRCKTSIRKVAEDMDYLAFLETLGSMDTTMVFMRQRPHVLV